MEKKFNRKKNETKGHFMEKKFNRKKNETKGHFND
jgi:hypothetical protein